MSREQANAHVLSLNKMVSKKQKPQQKIEFFFYANKEDDAINLCIELFQLGYEVYEPHKSVNAQWRITGWTYEISMTNQSVNDWSNQMLQLAEQNNCEFDGWGTFVE